LYRALALTYECANDLLSSPLRLADFIGGRPSGPKSANPYTVIVRKLWRGVPLRDTVRRYACCLALAKDQKIKPDAFAAWLSNYPGKIKQASNDWSKGQRLPEASVPRARDQKAEVDSLLSWFAPVPLPTGVAAGYQAGRYLAVIEVTTEGQASVIQVFTDMPPSKVDSFIVRELQR
jgi:hypothetical protein